VFKNRQKREGHPNPSLVVCENILETTLKEDQFDLVTIIGSTVKETEQYEKSIKKCFSLLNDNGHLMYMDFEKYHPSKGFEETVLNTNHQIVLNKLMTNIKA
jgi:ubiquinone/menaquinone biosynthesis C-methylase UbiE